MNTPNVLIISSEARFGSPSLHEKQVKRTAQGSPMPFTEAYLIQSHRCIGYLVHPFPKLITWSLTTLLFSLHVILNQGGSRGLTLVHESKAPTRKTYTHLQHTLRGAIQRLHTSSANNISLHDTALWMYLVHLLYYRTCPPDSSYPLVVMVEPTQYRYSNHLVPCLMRGKR
jgi:hypothetical protein